MEHQEAVSLVKSHTQKMKKTLKFNTLDPEWHQNPYPVYKRLRSEDPVHWSFMGVWVLTRYSDVKAVLRDPRFCVEKIPKNIKEKSYYDESKNFDALVQATSKWLIFLEPPDHTRLRSLVVKAFSPKVVESLRPHQQIVNQLIDRVRNQGRMDIILDLAVQLPTNVIATMLGLLVEDAIQLNKWSDELSYILDSLKSLQDYEQMNHVAGKFSDYLRSLIQERQKKPKEDLLSALIAAREQGDNLSEEEILSVCMLLFVAGEETTVNLIGNGMLALLQHPEQMQKLKQNPDLIYNAVEELLRYDSPIQMTRRIALENVDIRGKTIQAGDKALTVLGAANRDTCQFYHPDVLDITRSENRHFAFVDGIHYYLGAFLARVEGQIAIHTLLQKLPDIRLDANKLEWFKNIGLRGLKYLPVAFSV